MDARHASQIINQVQYKDWSFEAEPYDRYESTVKLVISFDAPDTSAPVGSSQMFKQVQAFYLHVFGCSDPIDIHSMVMHCIQHFEEHEMREIYTAGVTDDGGDWKPFHAHTNEGITNWLHNRRLLRTQDDLADVTILTFV